MAPQNRKGNTRMDAALDAMYQYGFEKQLVQKTVEELLDVYDGTQGWPFIEEASYKLLIETLLSKQEDSVQDKDSARRDGVNETTSAGILVNEITAAEILVNETTSAEILVNETTLHTGGDLDSSAQANDHDYVSLGNPETGVRNSDVPADRGGYEQDVNKSENKLKSMDTVKESNDSTFVNNVESTCDKIPLKIIQSSEVVDHLPCSKRKSFFGWIEDDGDDDEELIQFPIPPLSKQIEMMIGQCESPQSSNKRKRKSRWDVKPEGML